jgi:hypothetical protein
VTPGAHESASHWHGSAVQLQLVVSGAETLLSRNPAATVWTASATTYVLARAFVCSGPYLSGCAETPGSPGSTV